MTIDLHRPEGLPEWMDTRFTTALKAIRTMKNLVPGEHDGPTRELKKVVESDLGIGNRGDTVHSRVRQVYEIRMSQNPQTRGKLEAYLLAGLSKEKIAKRLGIHVKVVQLYHLLFFNISPDSSIDAKQQVLAAYKNCPASEKVPSYSYKVVAVSGGADALDLLLKDIGSNEISSLDDAASFVAQDAKSMLAFKLAEAAEAIDVSRPDSIRQLTNLMQQIKEVQPKDTLQHLLEQIEQMYQKLPLSMGEPDPDAYSPKMLLYEISAVELTYEEMLKVGMGQKLENEDELLNFKFPETPEDVAKMPKPFVAKVEEMLADDEAEEATDGKPKSSHPPQPEFTAAQLELIRKRREAKKGQH